VDLFEHSPPLSPYGESLFAFHHHVGSPNSYDDKSDGMGSSEDIVKEPMNILGIAIKIPKNLSDDSITDMFQRFCRERKDLLHEKRVRRITFIVLRHREFPKYFTYRARTDFAEDLIYR
jgi:hypothetical protein